MITRFFLAFACAAVSALPALAHDDTQAATSRSEAATASGEHVHVRTPGPPPLEVSTGVSSPDDEDYEAIDAILPPPKRTAVLLAEAYQCRAEKLAQGVPKLVPPTIVAAAAEPESLTPAAKPAAMSAPKQVAAKPPMVPVSAPVAKPARKLAAKKASKPAAEHLTTASVKPAAKPEKKPRKKKKPVAVITSIY